MWISTVIKRKEELQMKNLFKAVLVAGMLSLSVGFTSFAATTITGLADEISKEPNTFYTLYLGMSPADFHENWDDIPGWSAQQGTESATTFNTHTREIKLDGKKCQETVAVTYSSRNNIYYFSHTLYSNDVKLLAKYYTTVYNNCVKNYPGFENVKYDPTPRKGVGKGLKLDNNSNVTINFFEQTPRNGNIPKYKYFVSLSYQTRSF